jgi:uncharacterized membrane protein
MQALLPVHVVAGGLAIIVGAIALAAAKGARLHRKSGAVFAVAMVTMGLSGSALALRHGFDVNVFGGLLSAYLVLTAWATVRPPSAGQRSLAVGAMLLVFVLGSVNLALGLVAVGRPHMALQGVPVPAFFVLSLVALLAAAGDLRVIRNGVLRGAPRLSRHLWRMCFALFIATGSFFSIRARVARVLPAAFLAPGLRVGLILLPLLLMLFWLWRVRAGQSQRASTRNAPATA